MVQKIVTFNVALKSTERQWVQKIPEVYTNDLNSVSMQFNITDCTDLELTGSSAIVLLKMRDGSFFQGPSVDVTRTLNVFSYTLKENEGNHDGLAEIQLIVTIAGKEFGTQKYQFKVNAGLDSEVAREIMIYDWTSLTAEARAYIDQFTADELVRDAEFDNAQFDRNAAFNIDQAQRVTDFNAAEAARVAAFNIAHDLAGTDHTTALNDSSLAATDRTNAATDRTNAATDRSNAATDRTLAGTDHTTALSDHAILGGYNGRLTDVETDTSFDATNMVTNGDFSNGTTGHVINNATTSVTSNVLKLTANGSNAKHNIETSITSVLANNKYYMGVKLAALNANAHIGAVNVNSANGFDSYFGTPTNVGNKILSLIFTPSSVSATIPKLSFRISILNASLLDTFVGSGEYVDVSHIKLLNLTTIFGAGKEPTAAEMDRILARFTNSWFDGTKNLFAAKTAIEKQIALDGGAVMDASNLTTNGDFSNGVAGFSLAAVTTTNSTGRIKITANATTGEHYLKMNNPSSDKILTQNKYYLSCYLESVVNSKLRLIVFNRKSDENYENSEDTGYTSAGIKSVMFTPTSVSSTVPDLQVRMQIKNAAGSTNYTADGTEAVTIGYLKLTNLTATFGAGNEPTVEQMDAIMAKFENSWFDGTKNLFQAKASLNKLMALDARTEFEAKNVIVNGDFKTGLFAPWTGFAGTYAFTNAGKVIVSPNDSTMYVQPNHETSIAAKNGNKIYARTYIKSSVNAVSENLMLHAGVTQTPVSNVPGQINLPGGFISGIVTLAGQVEGRGLKIYVSNNFASTAMASTSQFEFGYVTLIDLTATFGAGKEPTLAEMDRLMARFPNSWFDGVKPIQTIETLYQEKANKTQEAWITPTLLNGAVNGTTALAYYKDQFGIVHLKGNIKAGTIGANQFVLPTGYKIGTNVAYFTAWEFTANKAVRVYIANGGDVQILDATAGNNVSFDGITFKAES